MKRKLLHQTLAFIKSIYLGWKEEREIHKIIDEKGLQYYLDNK